MYLTENAFAAFSQSLNGLSPDDMKYVAAEIFKEIDFFYKKNGRFEPPVVESAVMIALSRLAAEEE